MTGWERLGIGGLSQSYVAAASSRPRWPATPAGPAAPGRHLPQATTGPAVTAAGAHQASHEG